MRLTSFLPLIIISEMFIPARSAAQQEAAPELVTDRPDRTESASLVPPGMVQFESGVEWAGTNEEEAKVRTMTPGVLTRIAVSRWLEGRIGVSITRERVTTGPLSDSQGGLSELSAGAKVRLTDRLAAILTVALPVGALTAESAGANGILTASVVASERVGLGVNVGGGRDGYTQAWSMSATAALGVSLRNRLGGFLEVFGRAAEGVQPDFWVDGGITWAAAPNVQLDLSTGIRVVPAGPAWFAGGGFSVRLPR